MSNTMKKWLRRGLLVFGIFCFAVVIYRTVENAGGDAAYENAAQIAFRETESAGETLPESTHPGYSATMPERTERNEIKWEPEQVEPDEYMETLAGIDLAALREVNPDVVGWIMIPDTKINYPILQGEDNDFYLKHTWEKTPNPMGSVFLEYRNRDDFTEFNTIVYAHNMNNGSMFADLKDFSARWFRESHPYVYIVNDQGVLRYEVFSFYKAPVESFVYGLSFNQMITRTNFLESAKAESYAEMNVDPQITDRIITLSTCSGGTHENRWVVLARLKMVPREETP